MNLRQTFETARVVVRNLALGGNAAALTLAGRPRELMAYTSESLFLFKALNDRRGVPQKNVFEVLKGSGRTDVTLANLNGETWFWPTASYTADLVSLCLICRLLNPQTVFEIGTLNGYTALHFALNTGADAVVYSLDLPQEGAVQPALHTTVADDAHIKMGTAFRRRVFEGTEVERKIRPLYGDSAGFDFSPFHGQVDFFFVDGAHSYEYVASDTRNAFRCVRPNGVVAWHDFGRAGVNGVSRLVQEIAQQRDVYSIPGGSLAFTVVR